MPHGDEQLLADAPLTARCDCRPVADQPSHHVDALQRAVEACLQALVDYQTGLLDEEQLRQALYRDGMVLGDGEAWLLDLAGGTWRRYDGISTERIPAQSDGTPTTSQRAFDADTLRRWQRGLRGMHATTPLMGVAGG